MSLVLITFPNYWTKTIFSRKNYKTGNRNRFWKSLWNMFLPWFFGKICCYIKSCCYLFLKAAIMNLHTEINYHLIKKILVRIRTVQYFYWFNIISFSVYVWRYYNNRYCQKVKEQSIIFKPTINKISFLYWGYLIFTRDIFFFALQNNDSCEVEKSEAACNARKIVNFHIFKTWFLNYSCANSDNIINIVEYEIVRKSFNCFNFFTYTHQQKLPLKQGWRTSSWSYTYINILEKSKGNTFNRKIRK